MYCLIMAIRPNTSRGWSPDDPWRASGSHRTRGLLCCRLKLLWFNSAREGVTRSRDVKIAPWDWDKIERGVRIAGIAGVVATTFSVLLQELMAQDNKFQQEVKALAEPRPHRRKPSKDPSRHKLYGYPILPQ